ncbi:PREDICTED: serine/threonine-protein kinase-like protein CCR4 [Ipomoea nil]|uniref:serine/threonine-protein kinase-like protein CCR4 n=1 Tax=Ipomoea nil TaxID=35883 RepID=UPI0009019B15|nr:PREDICTED: serine/threonine-protein kinase-like protein CCR4 [Ipomoea nil]
MALLSANSFPFFFFSLLGLCFLPTVRSLSTVAISETGNQTLLICSLVRDSSRQVGFASINCTSFPAGSVQIPLNPSISYSGLVGGNGFLCALTSSFSSSISAMVCWRFSVNGTGMAYKRIYRGPRITDLGSGNSHICGIVENSGGRLQCWQWPEFRQSNESTITTNLALGQDFVCGLRDSRKVQCLGTDSNVTGHAPNGNYSDLAAGSRYACAVSSEGRLDCWGDMVGEKPDGEFSSLALGENRGCAIRRANGTVVCWGENGFSLPGRLQGMHFMALAARETVFCGVEAANSTLYCWGNAFFNSNPKIFVEVVPGPCTNSCPCNPMPFYGKFCSQNLMICEPCILNENPPSQPPLLPPPPSVPPTPPPASGNPSRWDGENVAFLVVGCTGSLIGVLALICYLFSRYCTIRGSSRIHDSGRLDDEEAASEHDSQATVAQPVATAQVLEKRLSQLLSMGNGGHLEEFSLLVLQKATDYFSDEHRIGTGSFGSVYHAVLEDGRRVAIKRAEVSTSSSYAGGGGTKYRQEDKDNAFLNELEFLSRLHHKNLVRLLGYCEDSNERLLVFEYMENGTLHDHLHRLESSPLMSWTTRIRVALDAARGIEYLHEYAVPQVIHRDIKSSNILLDSTWTAKVSDFGLSLMGPQDDESHLSLRAAGTMGYMDPEYYRLQLLTTKSDVYSFGVVLLELLSGHKAIHKNENGVPRNVVDYVVPYIVQDTIARILDPRVPPPTPFEIDAIAYVGYLAVDCVMLHGRDRPTMTEIVNNLERALTACLAPPIFSRSNTDDSST